MNALLLTFTAVFGMAQEDGRPSPSLLFEQAQTFIPTYDGDHRAFLTAEEERAVTAAAALLEASLALDSEQPVTWWWRGHCEVLLGENDRNRARPAEARAHYAVALGSFERSLELDPSSYWAHYARAMANLNLDAFWQSLSDFTQSIQRANAVIDGNSGDAPRIQDARFVRFKARQWSADARMRVFEFALAREEYRSFYADNGNNQWDLGYSLAESYARARDFAGARETYENILAVEEFRPFDSTYAQLGYIAGLLNDGDAAARWLEEALKNELSPGLYARLWMWILARGEKRDEAEEELSSFLQHPPASLSAWDAILGRFAMGEGSVADFLIQAREEEERRKSSAVPLDDLPCEVWYYVGLRHERDAAPLEGADQRTRLLSAVEAYREALSYAPEKFKWEWEYARSAFARLAHQLMLEAKHGFSLDGQRIETLADQPLIHPGRALSGSIETFLWHVPGSEKSRGLVAYREHLPHPGDLIQCVIKPEGGPRVAARLVIDIRNP